MTKKSSYGNDSISALKGADRVRLRPEVMFGRRDKEGAQHTVTEILGNSLDEARAGYGKVIKVVYHADKAISIRDYGRGVPLGWNENEQRWNWDLVYNELYAGGKYNADENYEFSVGLNGLGGCAVQYASEYFEVYSYSGTEESSMKFIEGNPAYEELKVVPSSEPMGTLVKWKPDKMVFTEIDVGFSWLLNFCEEKAHIDELTFIIVNEETGEETTIEGKGVQAYLEAKVGNRSASELFFKHVESKGTVNEGAMKKDYRFAGDIAIMLTTSKVPHIAFHNTTTLLRGVHFDASTHAVSTFFSGVASQRGVKLEYNDYGHTVCVLVSTYSNVTSWENQTKLAVTNTFIYDAIYKTVLEMLQAEYGKENPNIIDVVDEVVQNAITRQQVKEYEKQIRAANKAGKKPKPQKYVDCTIKDPKRRELWITEGDSAKGACKNARDKEFQALFPVRGKTLNVLKASVEDILKNEIVQNIITLVGTGIDLNHANLFDIDKLQFDKIIICTDADVDGYQIRVLLYAIFYRLMPELLRQGKVYVAETPLFEIETSSGSYFAYNTAEKNELLSKIGSYRAIHRSKGLGENNPDMLWNTTMNPEKRRLCQLKVDVNDEVSSKVTEVLFGADKFKERKSVLLSVLGTEMSEYLETAEMLAELEDSEESA